MPRGVKKVDSVNDVAANGVVHGKAPTLKKKRGRPVQDGSGDEVFQGKIMKVTPPDFRYLNMNIRGTSLYVQHKFSTKAMTRLRETQEAGTTARGRKNREAKDFEQLYKEAMYVSEEGWYGIPSSSFRNAMVRACSTVGVVMTHAKLAVFVEADGFDATSGDPLTRITVGEPFRLESPVRIAGGTMDIRARPAWNPGWEAEVRFRYDAGMIRDEDIVNLMVRVGMQVGLGEGRPSSPKSNGMGWGLFEVETEDGYSSR